ncbi:tape measure protein [Mesorhizobium koreense]|uniref:tape measure protein n=1 Tax=Mesorhizobium koreense TaxID=3074855 RepID=UPI00287B7EE7|nr:tape measure protein [Mesorhizobium sp. WR6]
MPTDQERIAVAIEARIRDFERNMAKAASTGDKNFDRIERRAKVSASRVQSSFSKVGLGVNRAFGNFGAGLLGGIAAGLTADKMKSLLDASTQITNALKVAGLSGDELNGVYDKLYQSAQRNAAPLEALVTLYSRVASSQKELGVSTGEVLTLTDNVAKSVRLTGGDAQQAAGALLQLSQALGGGKIQAEEYNSLIDGLRPLLQAAAAGMEQAGGSVAKLTALVKNGEVSSRAFFDAINAGAPILDQKLAGATLTVSQGFTQVYNSLLDAAKKFNETTETSQMLGSALGDLSTAIENFSVDNAVNQFATYINAANDAIHATNNFMMALGQKVGLDNVGRWFANTDVGKALGAHTLDSPEGRMGGVTPTVPPYLRQWIDKNYGGAGGSTPATPPAIKPIDITRPEYKPMPTSTGGGNRGASAGSMRAQHDAAKDLIADLEQEASLIGATDLEREKANALRRAGANATDAEKAKIGELVTKIHDENEAHEQQQAAMEKIADAEKQFVGGLAHDLLNGVSPAEALRNALSRLADTLLNEVLDAIFRVKSAGAGGGGGLFGGIFSLLGGLFGGGLSPVAAASVAGGIGGLYADGGDVRGPGTATSDSIVARLSDGEFVVRAAAAKKHRALLQAINTGRVPAFAHGGSVGGGNVARITPAANSNTPAVTVNSNVTVNANGSDPASNNDLAAKVGKQVEGQLRGVVQDEIRRNARPGGFLNSRSR